MIMDTPLVSWLIPMYNNGISAKRAIDSILQQTYSNFEVIIVLDPSNQETILLCEEYKTRDKRVHIIANETRLGIAGSLNKGLEYCSGKYIARMDADDYSYPDRLQKQVDYMEQHPDIGLLGGNARNIIKKTQQSYIVYPEVPDSEEIKVTLLFGNCIVHPTILFRAEITEKIKYPNIPGEDYAFYTELLPIVKMAILPDIVLDYSVYDESTTYVTFKKSREISSQISRAIIQRMFKIDTAEYTDNLFGWRIPEDISDNVEDVKKFLHMHYSLIRQIIKENVERKLFNQDVLLKVLNKEWKHSLSIVEPFNQLSVLNAPVECMEINDIDMAFFIFEDESKYVQMEQVLRDADRIIVYGTGKFCNEYMKKESGDFMRKVVCFCDSNHDKQGAYYYDKKVISPEQLISLEFDVIAIASPNFEMEIKQQLEEKNISREKIISLAAWDLMRWYKTWEREHEKLEGKSDLSYKEEK